MKGFFSTIGLMLAAGVISWSMYRKLIKKPITPDWFSELEKEYGHSSKDTAP